MNIHTLNITTYPGVTWNREDKCWNNNNQCEYLAVILVLEHLVEPIRKARQWRLESTKLLEENKQLQVKYRAKDKHSNI